MAAGQGVYENLYKVIGAGRATAANNQVARSYRGLHQATRAAASGLMGMRSAMLGQMIAVAGGALAIRRAVNEYEQYTNAVTRTNTVLAAQTINHRQNTRLVRDLSESVGNNLGYSLNESNDAMSTMLQTGLGVHRSMRVFGTSMQLARVAGMDTARTTQFLTDTMNMFRVEQARTGETARDFSRRMSSQLIVAANSASTSVEQLQQAFRYAGGEMSSLGYTSQDTMAALAALSSVGLRGTTAGTRLRGAIAALHTPSSTTREMFRQWGVTEADLNTILYTTEGRLRQLAGPDGAMTQLANLVQRLPSQQARNTAIIRLFGRRALAAGAALTGLSEAGERAARIGERLQRDDVRSGSILDETSRVAMQSFGMQMTQLREGVRDLAIAFGEMLFGGLSTAEDGFGTVFRQMVRGIRLAGSLGEMTADQRREWEQLSPATRDQAQSWRELLSQVVDGLKVFAQLMRGLGWIISNGPRVVLALVAIRVATGSWTAGLLTNTTALMASSTATVGWRAKLSALGAVMNVVRLAAMGLAIWGIGRLTSRLQENMVTWSGYRREYEQVREQMGGIDESIRNSIPIVGDLIAQYAILLETLREVGRVMARIAFRREQKGRERLGATAEERMNAIMAQRRAQGRIATGQEEQVRLTETRRESARSMMRTAAVMHQSGIRTAEQVSDALANAGMAPGEAMNQLAEQIVRAQRDATGMRSTARELGAEGARLPQAMADSTRQLVQFQGMLERLNAMSFGIAVAPVDQSIPTAGDAIINRGGVIRATAGDVLVNRASLAQAITSRPGGMTGEILGGAQTMAGPGGSAGGGGTTEVVIEVPLNVDGREVARAVGRAHITHLERSGAGFQPGQRRTMAESGFMERLG